MSKGMFISVEGNDGSGKSTQMENIKEYMKKHNLDVIFTREPGGTDIGEKIRELLLDINNKEMSYMTEALLYSASRAQHVEEKIKPALMDGKHVICDRFIDSSIAYQGYGRELGDVVKTINNYAVNGTMPDYTLFLHLHPEKCKDRMKANRESLDRLEKVSDDFHMRIYDGYKKIVEENKKRFIVIEADGTEEEVWQRIKRELDKIFFIEIFMIR